VPLAAEVIANVSVLLKPSRMPDVDRDQRHSLRALDLSAARVQRYVLLMALMPAFPALCSIACNGK
jgi:hypothetical protein